MIVDLLYLGITGLFFGGAWLLVELCDRLNRGERE